MIFSWDVAAINPLANSKYSLLLHCRLKLRCLLRYAWVSWALIQRQYQLAAFLVGTLNPYPVSSWKIVLWQRKTATRDFSQPVWSSLSIPTTERSRDFTRIERRRWVLPPWCWKIHFECQGWGMHNCSVHTLILPLEIQTFSLYKTFDTE